MTAPELTVVGAGPAGLAAAATAAEAGITTVMLDEYPHPGGQYFRQPETDAARRHVSAQQREGASRIDELRATGAQLSGDTTVYAVEDGVLLALHGAGVDRFDTPMILAPGATERVVPVSGWTLPGVVTCGAAQILAKSQGIAIGSRVLVAGSGPFLLPVAASLIELGARVIALVEAQPLRFGAMLSLATSLSRLREGSRYLATIVRAGVPVLTRHAVIRIDGISSVSSAVVAELDAHGMATSTKRRFDVDAVCLSDGFIPSTDLCELAGADVAFDPGTRTYGVSIGWQTGATTARNVWAAGACVNGLGGAQLARAGGMLAGLAAVEALRGSLSRSQSAARARALAEARHHARFARHLAAVYPTMAGWYTRPTDATIVCRCEDVCAGDIRAATLAGAADVNLVKRWTRAGMGLCQGRTCQSAVAELVAATGGQLAGPALLAPSRPLPDVGRFRPRPPIRPVPLEALRSG